MHGGERKIWLGADLSILIVMAERKLVKIAEHD
jgi:hypothetical protein